VTYIRSHKGSTPNSVIASGLIPARWLLATLSWGGLLSLAHDDDPGDMHQIRIGKRCSIQDGSVCHITHAGPYNPDGWPLIVGDDVTVGHKAVLHGCTIGSRVLVGMGTIIMDGARVDDEVIIAAGTLVPPGKHLESGYLYRGSPVRQARELTQEERDFFTYTASNYVRLKDEYRADGPNFD